jgi:hypothetical protein
MPISVIFLTFEVLLAKLVHSLSLSRVASYRNLRIHRRREETRTPSPVAASAPPPRKKKRRRKVLRAVRGFLSVLTPRIRFVPRSR